MLDYLSPELANLDFAPFMREALLEAEAAGAVCAPPHSQLPRRRAGTRIHCLVPTLRPQGAGLHPDG